MNEFDINDNTQNNEENQNGTKDATSEQNPSKPSEIEAVAPQSGEQKPSDVEEHRYSEPFTENRQTGNQQPYFGQQPVQPSPQQQNYIPYTSPISRTPRITGSTVRRSSPLWATISRILMNTSTVRRRLPKRAKPAR